MAIEQWQTGVTTEEVRLNLMLQGSGSAWAAPKCVLFTNNFQPTEDTVWANITEATFDGYAAATPAAPGTPYIGADGFIHVTWPSVQFTMTGETTSQTVYGWGLTNVAKTVWVGGNLLPTPIPMTDTGDAIIVVPDLIYGQ